MNSLLRKFFLTLGLAALVLVALPAQTAYALAPTSAGTPAPENANLRLEWAFARMKISLERISLNREYSDTMIARVADLLAKAKANGKDVRAIETALAAYKDALVKGKPVYEKAQSIVDEHAGFSADGKVTDATTARQTVKNLGEALKQYRDTVGEAAKALRAAIRAFRQANPRPQK